MSRIESAHALNRFGLGARPGEIDRLAAYPQGRLIESIAHGADRSASAASRDRLVAFLEARQNGTAQTSFRERVRREVRADIIQRIETAARTDSPVAERMVHFWANHFTVAVNRPQVGSLAKPFEDEAIRPHVNGRFADMLGAVVRHPAMLLYLDNAISFGPNSPAGRRSGRGLNENLARELLELHTLGVNGGYGQDDVIALAKILTGWSVSRLRDLNPGTFRYHDLAHEPGPKTLLGHRFDQGGEAEGEAALDMLARHPSTARHIATKLARHFVADEPPETAIEALSDTFTSTDGSLTAMCRTMLELPEAWQPHLAKVRTPNDLLIAALRALDVTDVDDRSAATLRLLGQVPWTAPSPAGWPDEAADWLGPEALMRRIDWAVAVAGIAGNALDPQQLLETAVGPLASATTVFHVSGAPSAQEGVAIVLSSPEFQRR
ncbi:MAG: DUF1800 domain-containing protein [Pseudomonadota bacterium]